MRNAKSALFLQVDHEIKEARSKRGIVVLPSPEAYEKLGWTRNYFEKKPSEGYFIWLKKQIDFPLITCVTIASPKTFQNLTNLLVIEKNIKAKANVVCNAAKNNLCGTHKAQGKLILREGSALTYNHLHKWGKKDFVSPDYEFVLEERSRLSYTYKNLFPPKNLRLKTTVISQKDSSCNLSFIINGFNSKIEIKDSIFLKGKGARGIVRLRLVGRKESQTKAISKIVAEEAGKGHLDCQGLLIDEDAEISLVPELVCQNRKAQITHEASIGKVSEEVLSYLRTRGLSEDEAIDLIVAGFLGEEEPITTAG